jgi:hypothetical protein
LKELRDEISHARRKLEALRILVDKAEELGRIPVKSDLSEEESYLVKSVCGPLPRALEAAGLKEVSEHYKQKQMRRKQKRIEKKRASKGSNSQ